MTESPSTVTPEELLAHAGWIRALARGLVRDPGALEDAVQETWIAASGRLRAGHRTSRAWLAAVLRNALRQGARSEAGRAARERGAARDEALPSPDELLARVEHQRMLVEAVSALDEPHRSAVVLRYYEGLSSAEIARRLGVPAGRVRMRLSRALASLRESMDRRFGGDRSAWMQALLPLAEAAPSALVSAGGAQAALATGVLGMKFLTLAGLGVLLVAGVYWVTLPARPDEPLERASAAAAAVGPRTRAAEDDRPLAPRPGDAAPAEALLERGERALADDAPIVQGVVVAPDGSPPDASLEVLALRAETSYERLCELLLGHVEGDDCPLHDALLARTPAAADGRFRLSIPDAAEGAGALHLTVRGSHAYLPRTVAVDLPATSPVELRPRCGARVTGTVRGPQGASAVAGVALELRTDALDANSQDERDGEALALELRSGPDGRFELPPLPVGLAHRVVALPEDLAARLVTLDGLQPCSERELELELAAGARVSGTVLDASGGPIAGAEVRALLAGTMLGFDDVEVRRARTDEAGRFELPALPPGALSVQARARGFLDGRRVPLELADRAHVADLGLELGRGQSIAGRVEWPDGTPASGVEVRAGFDPSHGFGPTAFNALRGAEGSAHADEGGAFRISGLGGGPFVVRCEARGTDGRPHRARVDGVAARAEGLRLTLRPPLALEGRVLDPLGRPLDDVTITASRLVEGALGETASSTVERRFRDPQGRFSLDDLEAGRWRLDARAPGHAQVALHMEELPRAPDAIPLVLLLERAASAAGVVRTPAGAPVAGATVQVDSGRSPAQQRFSRLPPPPSATTDEDGRFVLEPVAPGPASLRAAAAGYARSDALPIEAAPGERLEGLALTLALGATVTGEVYEESGAPAAGRMVNVIRWQLGDVDSHLGRTDADGRFRIEGIEPGSWTVLAIDSDADLSTARPGGNAAAMLDSMEVAPVELTEGETEHVVLGTPPADPVRVHGRVRQGGRPFGDAVIGFLHRDAGTLQGMAQTGVDEEGRYELLLDGPGSYVVTLNPLAGRPGEQGVLPFAREVPARAEFELDLDVPLGRISGRVLGPDSGPVEARVTLSVDGPAPFPGGRFVETRTDGDGRYELDALPDGTYRVHAGGSSFLPESPARARVVRRGVEVQHGAHVEGVDFRLPEAGSIEVRATDAGGNPVAGAVVFVRDASGTPLEPLSACTTDGAGRAVYDGLAPGEHTVLARTSTLASSDGAVVRVRAGAAATVELRLEAATLLSIEVTRDGEPRHARVSVTDADGRELASLLGVDELHRLLAQGDLSGNAARVGPLAPGRYQVQAEADGLSASKPVVLGGEPERRLILRLR